MPYFGHLSGRLFFNKISRKYKAKTNYPIAAKVRAKTAHKKIIDNFSPPELERKWEGGGGGEPLHTVV